MCVFFFLPYILFNFVINSWQLPFGNWYVLEDDGGPLVSGKL